MKNLARVLASRKRLRAIGFDDTPFKKAHDRTVNIAGVVTSACRFEGMLWGEAQVDGTDANAALVDMLTESKFYSQCHLVLTDGVAVGGFNVIDLPALSDALQLPCVAVMRRPPDMQKISTALANFVDGKERWQTIQRAGNIHHHNAQVFQCAGCTPETALEALRQITDTGQVPECLRLAHLIGAAVKTGQSSRRA